MSTVRSEYKYFSLDHRECLNPFQLMCIKLKLRKNDLLELYSLFKGSHDMILETLKNHKVDNIPRKIYQHRDFRINYKLYPIATCSFCSMKHTHSDPYFLFAWNFFEKGLLSVNQSCSSYLLATMQLAHISNIYLLLGDQFLDDITQYITRIMIIHCFQRHFI